MPGFTKFADIQTAIAAGQTDNYLFDKTLSAAPTADTWVSFWLSAGTPVAGATQTNIAPTAATVGAMNQPGTIGNPTTNAAAVSTQLRSLITFGASCNIIGNLMIYDRLMQTAPVAIPTTAGAAAVTSTALTRYTSGVGVQCWLEVTTATATTAPTIYLNSYTGSVNGAATNAGASAIVTFPAAATKVNCLVGPMPLAAGDTGVKAVADFTDVAAPSAGAVSVLLIKPLVYLPLGVANTWTERDWALQFAALEQVQDNACLAIAMYCQTATAPVIHGRVATAWN